MKKHPYNIIFLLSLLLFLLPVTAHTQGNLLVTPVRVVFENGKTKQDINLTNIGQDTAVYMVSFLHYRMQEDGSFKQIDNPGSLTDKADKYLRIFPRRVTLPPNESQTIRLQYRKLSGIQEGEYRSHLYLRAEKKITPLGLESPDIDSSQMAVQITPIFGISIPVIIRNGNTDMNISLSDVKLEAVNDSVSQLNVTINRSGKRSSYGNLKVDYIPANGKTAEVGAANGIGVYTEINRRTSSIRLHTKKGQKFDSGKLLIRYVTPDEEGNKELASTEYRLTK